MSLIHHLGGFDSLLTLMNAMLGLLAACIGKRFIDGGLHPLPAAGIVALGMATAGFHFYLRPHLATIILLAVAMAWLVDYERGRISRIRLWLLIPLGIVWTNLHGGVLGCIFTFALAIGGWLAFRTKSRSDIGYLILVLIGCVAATLLNPFFLDMHRTWLSIIGSTVLKAEVSEHQPLSLARTDGQAVVGFAIFYLLMLAGTLPQRPRVTWLIPLVWFGLAVSSIRHGPLFVVVALVALADLLPQTVWFRLLQKHGDTFVLKSNTPPRWIGWRAWAAMAILVLIPLTLQLQRIRCPVIGYGWARFDEKLVPWQLKNELEQYAASRPDNFPIFNDCNLGGFLIYYTPTLKIFMDDRFELYSESELSDYIDMMHNHPENIERWREKAAFDRAFVENGTVMDAYLQASANWREIARCKKAVIYARVTK